MVEGNPGPLRAVKRGEVAGVGAVRGSVSLCFTERTGGVSRAPYATLNLGDHVGDQPAAVAENRRRALALIDATDVTDWLVVPHQVHGDTVVVLDDASPEAWARVRDEAVRGADGVVCVVPNVPVLLCFADCTPVVITCPRGFAIAHAGWRGAYARIPYTAACALREATGCAPDELEAFIGPHILGDEYEVSVELAQQFVERFGPEVAHGRLLDLFYAVRAALRDAGLADERIFDPALSTMRHTDRFYSYRAEGGTCGRHAALAIMYG